MMFINLLAPFLNILLFDNVAATEETVVVTIKSGKVLGKKLTTADLNVDFYAFQGIPYAQPPLGNLRFRPPIPVGQWSGILNTTEDKPQCIQNLGDGSEDCLFINVFSPTVYSLERLPVFVWFFGGYFISGDSTRSSYGPDYFLEEGVVVVTFNYRLGVFGFLSTEDDVAPGNWALKDQILALKWIQENIEVFGGDPNSVTLAGESAGSVCISYLLQCPLAKNLFHRAVLQSGTSLNYLALSRNPREIAFEIGRLFGIFTNDSKHLVNELRKIDEGMLQLFSFAKNLLKTLWDNPRNGISFSPNIEPASDTAVITNKSYGLWKKGEFMKVPLMIGFNSQESVTVLWVIGAARGFLEVYDISPELLIPVDFNLKTSDFFKRIAVATEIRLHYFGIVPLTLDINHLLQFITDDQFVRGITETVRLASNFTTVYFYRFSYAGDLGLYPSQKRVHEGVGHTEELNYMWNRETNIKNPSQDDLTTRRRLVKLWTNFMKMSDPTPESDELLQDVQWIPSSPQNSTYLDIGKKLIIGNDLEKYSISWWKKLYKKYAIPPLDTY